MILEDTKIARLMPGPAQIVDEAPGGRLHVDGHLIVDSIDGPARMRRKLSFAGIIFITVAINGKFDLADDIVVIADGIPDALVDELEDIADKAFQSIPRSKRKDNGTVEDALRVAVRRAADDVWGKTNLQSGGCQSLV